MIIMMRLVVFSAVFFFALAPLANAQNLPNGAVCRTDHPSDCQSQYCAVVPGSTGAGTGVCSNTPLSGGGSGNASGGGYSGTSDTGGSGAVSAQSAQGAPATDAPNLSFVKVVQALLGFIVRMGIIIVILMLAYAGYLFMSAQNDPNQAEDARKMLRWAIICALVIFGVQVISWGLATTAQTLAVG